MPSFHPAYLAVAYRYVFALRTHPLNLQLGSTPQDLSIKVVDPMWDHGCLEYFGCRVVYHQGFAHD